LGPQIVGTDAQKYRRSVLFPKKFGKDPFRGVDGSDSNKSSS